MLFRSAGFCTDDPYESSAATIHLGDLPEGCLAASGPLIPSVRSCFECRAADRHRCRPWCALTAPFHPCLIATEVAPSAVCSLLHGMSGFPDLARASTLSCEVPTFLNRALSAQLRSPDRLAVAFKATGGDGTCGPRSSSDRKSTRLNSSH